MTTHRSKLFNEDIAILGVKEFYDGDLISYRPIELLRMSKLSDESKIHIHEYKKIFRGCTIN